MENIQTEDNVSHSPAEVSNTCADGYTLKYPYKLATGEMLTCVTLRRLKVADMKAAKRQFKNSDEWDEALIARMTELNPEDLTGMDLEDYQALSKRFRQFAGLADE
ncbi:phage tail assembly protein [Salmonella enterica subsp. diarizonae]|uniref:Phage tail assembly protein n=1 Tax=Salmonella diarizonae TaxID=59204 RepID=A0A379TUJ1_SALDZ|nr:phage tail assembly protein [Salmonella enterica]ECD7556123.1 phage tail assembly protein [Salmonella enterica subsp. enterica serovar Muenchen]EDQ6553136.1 phage tail assembly protein [Salmonella enterica subsp. enterica]HBJ6841612.1 phage tail assembly protein [Salmonella enterica subsp. diarizonae serovar 48:i:z]ECH9341152.1 phage tail assembly protein [Salmonella enterica subsp. diarizonae]EDU9901829.1 phage tail assembly protein [Salmonella enterica subsp. diarizonae]